MTAKEKAKELVEKFRKDARLRSSGFLVANEKHSTYHAKQCALVCVDEIIKALLKNASNLGYDNILNIERDYWQEVIIEINRL